MKRARVGLVILAGLLAACGGTPAGRGGSGTGSAGTSVAGSGSGSGGDTAAASNGTTESSGGATTSVSETGSASGSSTASSSGASASSGSGSTTGTRATGSTASSSTASTGSSGIASCYPDGSYVGAGNAIDCCSGAIDGSGYCAPGSIDTSSNGTTGAGTTTGDSAGSTTGGGTTTGAGTTSGGSTGATCAASCYAARGFHCENGQCVLNGGSGQLQITLNWGSSLQTGGQRAREDLDLHVVEPFPDGGPGRGGYEIYYGNTHPAKTVGWLDLDQNAGCGDTDNTDGYGNDTENVIYPDAGGAPHGIYKVIVDDYDDQCDGTSPSPFYWTLTIRKGTQVTVYDGGFSQTNAQDDADQACLNSACANNDLLWNASDAAGHKVFTFTY